MTGKTPQQPPPNPVPYQVHVEGSDVWMWKVTTGAGGAETGAWELQHAAPAPPPAPATPEPPKEPKAKDPVPMPAEPAPGRGGIVRAARRPGVARATETYRHG